MSKMSSRKTLGFSLLELLVVIGLLGILAAMLPFTIRKDQIQTRQAAKLLAQQIQLARFEAVRRNRFAGVYVPLDGLSFTVYEDTNNDRSYTNGSDTVIRSFALKTGDYSRVKLNLSGATAPQNILFDPRSFLYTSSGTPSTITTLKVQSTDNANYVWKVEITTQGRVIRVIQ